MHTPQIVYLFLTSMSLGIALAKHGKPKTGSISFWTALVAVALEALILYWGGFFN